MKVTVTLLALFMVTTHEPLPVHDPDQPVNVEPAAGAADKVTVVPEVMLAEQVAPQEIPPPVTVPLPEPALVTVRV